MKAYIKALAYNLPEKILDNEQVAAMFPEWKFIMDRLTICQKYMMTKNIDKEEFGAAITPATIYL